MRVLGLIPARGGSKGVPRKNVRLLAGRPLLAYTAESACRARRLTRLVLSTDDPDIAALGTALGLEVPFVRPPELAADDTPMLAVLQHALDAIEDDFDALCLLQPTSPLRAEGLIDECIDLLDSSGADAVMTVRPVPHEHNPHWVYERSPQGALFLSTGEETPIGRRQDLPAAFHRDGSVYVFRPSFIHAGQPYGQDLRGVVVEATDAVNIDDLDDWERAEALLGRGC